MENGERGAKTNHPSLKKWRREQGTLFIRVALSFDKLRTGFQEEGGGKSKPPPTPPLKGGEEIAPVPGSVEAQCGGRPVCHDTVRGFGRMDHIPEQVLIGILTFVRRHQGSDAGIGDIG